MTGGRLAPDRRCIVDTSAYYALIDSSDRHHSDALVLLRHLADQRWRLFTTNLVIAETHALVLNRLGRGVALAFLGAMAESSTTVERVTPADEQRALEIIRQYQDKDFSLTDASTFSVAGRIGVTIAFSFDRNFNQYGLSILQAD